jgi:hypothetical protein
MPRRKRSFGTSKSHFIEPQGGYQRQWRKFKPVKPSGSVTAKLPGVAFNKNVCKEIRSSCATKLVFLKGKDAKALGTKPGPNLLYCLSKTEVGPVVPVSSPREATALGEKYCACTRGGSTTKECAGQMPAFGRKRSKRRNRR